MYYIKKPYFSDIIGKKTMKHNFLQSFIKPYLRFSAKFIIKNQVINFPDSIINARSVLVFMPEKLEEFGIARNFLAVLSKNFPNAKITLVMLEQYRNLVDKTRRYGTIFVTLSHKNVLGLPKKELIQKFTSTNFDSAIDLNQTFNLLTTYLCQKSGAKLRIGLEDKDREPFYNFSFRANTNERLDIKYRKMFKYLDATINGNSL